MWLPADLKDNILYLVSSKSITILEGEEGKVPASVAIIPFPSLELKGLIKPMVIRDNTRRGGVIESSLSVIFNQADDLIFYKYINNFKALFIETTATLVKLEESKAERELIEEELNKFYQNILHTLNDLYEAETAGTDEAFAVPEEINEDLKKFRFKVVVCGDPAVGKTSTVLRFTDKAFRRTYIPTVGVNISEKVVRHENSIIEFIIWDVAGQAKFQMVRRHFYSGADGQLLLFDLTRLDTFESIPKWYQDIKSTLKSGVHGLILGNKNDLVNERKIEKGTISKLAAELGLETVETSALTGENVDEAFHKLGKLLIKQKTEGN